MKFRCCRLKSTWCAGTTAQRREHCAMRPGGRGGGGLRHSGMRAWPRAGSTQAPYPVPGIRSGSPHGTNCEGRGWIQMVPRVLHPDVIRGAFGESVLGATAYVPLRSTTSMTPTGVREVAQLSPHAPDTRPLPLTRRRQAPQPQPTL